MDSFHDADNFRYDCWPHGATEGTPAISCAGTIIIIISFYFFVHAAKMTIHYGTQ